MSLQDQIEQYLMGATNLSRNQLRSRLNDIIAPKPKHSLEDSPESHVMLGSQRDMLFRATKQEFPSTAIRQTSQPQTNVPSGPTSVSEISGVTMLRVDPADSLVKMYEDCILNGTLGPEV